MWLPLLSKLMIVMLGPFSKFRVVHYSILGSGQAELSYCSDHMTRGLVLESTGMTFDPNINGSEDHIGQVQV